MNNQPSRMQRRIAERMAAKAVNGVEQIQINYGHNGKEVMAVFSKPIQNLAMTPAQLDDFIGHLQGAKEALLQHIANSPKVIAHA